MTPSFPTRPSSDLPDKSKRGRMVVCLRIYWDLIADGAGWRGQGYSPEDGRYYRAHLRAKGNKLTMKGCVAVFCRTVTWTRVSWDGSTFRRWRAENGGFP